MELLSNVDCALLVVLGVAIITMVYASVSSKRKPNKQL